MKKLLRHSGSGRVWAAALALFLAGALAPPAARASSHREAPLISTDPEADNTDTYFFLDPLEGGRVVMIGNWIPLEEPAGGPNFWHFGESIRYEFNVDWDGDAIEDVVYRVTFTRHVRNPNTWLQNTGPVLSPTDPNLNVYYTYKVEKILGPSPDQAAGAKVVLGNDLLEAPNNVGPKSFPGAAGTPAGAGYGKGSDIASTVYTIDQDTKVFAGPRADGFYADLGMIFDLINFRAGTLPGNMGGGRNGLAGFNTHTIALSVPVYQLTKNHTLPTMTTDPNAIISMWSSTWRLQNRVLSDTGQKPADSGAWVQVSRLGVPLVNEVVIPLGQKDLFNASYPSVDAQFAPSVLDPEVPKILKALFNIDSPPAPRNDLLAVVLGVDGLTRRPGEVVSDQLRLNVAVFPTPPSLANRMGVLGGDLAGFPNGRRPYDDVVDIELQILAGVLVPAFNHAPNNQLGDGVDGPDKAFNPAFPWLATPHSGFEHRHDDVPQVIHFGAE
ncbi:MAG: hypothetical protein DMF54_01645 [Acidobacteria bacterium]|nr:MAG: hypothetical protein DMF54_01645 [Acidobacteriota bacterium]